MKFGTSGIRGLVADLQGHASALYATAFAHHLLHNSLAKPGDTVFVGEDYRPSSPDIAETCVGALRRAGLKPVSCGALPTPSLALYAMSNNSASLMVTGSHIPADRNGIKFYRPDGEIDKADEQSIIRIAEELNAKPTDFTSGIAPNEALPAKELFAARTRAILPPGSLSGLKVGVYQHSTVARDELVETIASYGAEVIAISRSETFIPVDTEAISSQTVCLLKSWATKYGTDAIVSADGDGDRPLVSDENGLPLRGDLLGILVAQFLGAQVVVTPITSNSGIEHAGKFNVVRTRVGSPYVIAGMNEAIAAGKHTVLGFEANGGVLVGSDFQLGDRVLRALPTRDCFLPILAALFRCRQSNKPLSALVAQSGLPFAHAGRLENFPSEVSAALMDYLNRSDENIAEWLRSIGSVSAVNKTDGLRMVLTDKRILHLRPSGNAPEMRCYVEAEDEEAATELLQQGLTLIKQWAINR